MADQISQALNSYKQAASLKDQNNQAEAASHSGTSFSDILSAPYKSARESLINAETTANLAAQGQASQQDLILAMQNASVTLEGLKAIHEKTVAGVQDILKMQA